MQYVRRFSQLIDLERKAEIQKHREEIERQTPKERQAQGRCLLYLKGKPGTPLFHFSVIRYVSEKKIFTKMSAGDLVLVSRGNPFADYAPLTGTIKSIEKTSLTVMFESPPPKWAYRSGIRLDLYANDVPYTRMLDNLQKFIFHNHPLKSVILGERPIYMPKPVNFDPLNPRLNDSQKEAISHALGTRDIFLIHGPPGTGKTTTIVELMAQAVGRGKRVLATAESNTAVDNMLCKLKAYPDLKMVRLGHPARIMEGCQSFSIYHHFEQHPQGAILRAKWAELDLLRRKQKTFEKPTPQKRRGMDDHIIAQHARSGKGYRGVRAKAIGSMYRWMRCQEQIDYLTQRLRQEEQAIMREILEGADVVLTTNSSAACELMEKQYFDLAVIDEGSQQVEPSTLIPLLKARRVIIAGDDQQLPPTVISHQATKELSKTLFERLRKSFPQNSRMLRTQYRMHEAILRFSKEQFYNHELESDLSVHRHTILDLLRKNGQSPEIDYLNPLLPLVFHDTSEAGVEAFEVRNKKQVSFENPYEAQHLQIMIQDFLDWGIDPTQLGVITPYQAQVQRLRRSFENLHFEVEVNTVDGFQGREKEIILYSTVRANDKGEIGFLSDLRRLNVAATRARRKFIIVGHGDTLRHHDIYRQWLGSMQTPLA